MPWNSSSRLNATSGFHSMIVERSSARLSPMPSTFTSWPIARSEDVTSYSVRHSSICWAE